MQCARTRAEPTASPGCGWLKKIIWSPPFWGSPFGDRLCRPRRTCGRPSPTGSWTAMSLLCSRNFSSRTSQKKETTLKETFSLIFPPSLPRFFRRSFGKYFDFFFAAPPIGAGEVPPARRHDAHFVGEAGGHYRPPANFCFRHPHLRGVGGYNFYHFHFHFLPPSLVYRVP